MDLPEVRGPTEMDVEVAAKGKEWRQHFDAKDIPEFIRNHSFAGPVATVNVQDGFAQFALNTSSSIDQTVLGWFAAAVFVCLVIALFRRKARGSF